MFGQKKKEFYYRDRKFTIYQYKNKPLLRITLDNTVGYFGASAWNSNKYMWLVVGVKLLSTGVSYDYPYGRVHPGNTGIWQGNEAPSLEVAMNDTMDELILERGRIETSKNDYAHAVKKVTDLFDSL